jgi:protein gp37
MARRFLLAENSKIEWTDHTFNPWRGCTKVSEGCKHCYAETLSGRNPASLGIWGPKGTRVVASESYWKHPIKWNREAEKEGVRKRVFCASLADVFEGPETMPESEWPKVEQARVRLWDLIHETPHLDWLLLTKRPENVIPFWLTPDCGDLPEERGYCGPIRLPPNVWIGTSVEVQKAADERIPHLLKIPAKIRFLSCEPLLGPVDLTDFLYQKCCDCEGTGQHMVGLSGDNIVSCGCNDGYSDLGHEDAWHWVICGGESGANVRPMHPDWARSLRDQCQAAGVPFFFKQWGEYIEDSEGDALLNKPLGQLLPWELTGRTMLEKIAKHVGEGTSPDCIWMFKVGKHKAGRLLDGQTWEEYPEVPLAA